MIKTQITELYVGRGAGELGIKDIWGKYFEFRLNE